MIGVLAGLVACLGAWQFVLRRGAGAPLWPGPNRLAAALDVLPVLLGFGALLLGLARPLLAGLVVAALAGGLALADRVKRAELDEPVVFADRAELLEVARHPRLYLPFAGSAWVLGTAFATGAAFVASAAWMEPPLWHRSPALAGVEAVGAALLAYGALNLTSVRRGLGVRVAADYVGRLQPARDPACDAARLGPLATLIVHATVAAAERPARQAAVDVAACRAMAFAPGGGPVVLVQAESFMNPGRLHPTLSGLLPHFAAPAKLRGRFSVPAWGANTVRSEFAVLSGVAEAALGLDSFNPYDRFVGGRPLPSLARAARAAGYTSVFVHPFDLSFYGRHRALRHLGFDELVGPEAFRGAARRGNYVADEAIAPVVASLLRRHGPAVFVFAATMEAHGPWAEGGHGADCVVLPEALRGLAQTGALGRWLWHLQGTDRMLGALREAVGDGWLAVYGDHQPNLAGAFAALGLPDRRTDYAVWGPSGGPARTCDLAAHELGAALGDLMVAAERRSQAA